MKITKSLAFAIALATPAMAFASTSIGNVSSRSGADGDISAAPIANGGYAFVSTFNGVDGAGQIAGVQGTNGSEYITDLFTANAGDSLNFYFNYITTDGSDYTDYAFAELLDGGLNHIAWLFTARTTPSGDTSPGFALPANDGLLNPASSAINPNATTFSGLGGDSGSCWAAGCGNTGWIESVYGITTGGDYALRLGVSNVSDVRYDSALAFSGVTVAGTSVSIPGGVPEPATWAMLIGGVGLVGTARRRQRAKIAFA